MTDVDEFVENFFQHAEYDPVKAREYYLRTRKLKGRKPGKPVDRRSNLNADGEPIHKLGQRFEEDEVPQTSPTGAKLVDYLGAGLGKATYADGTVFDATKGWEQKRPAVKANDTKSRINAARQKLNQAKKLANKKKDPKVRASLLRRLAGTEQKLKAAEGRL